MERKTLTVDIGNGQHISFETGKIAKQANGAVLARMGETIVFSTACAVAEPDLNVDFLPLRVDYQEKFSSAGKTLGGFIKREGRPTERETLVGRLIDRPLRPMFEEGYYNETQILSYVLSYDGQHQPEPLAICSAAAAIYISDIAFNKPLAAVRVGMIGHHYVINPTAEQMAKSKLDLVLAGTEDAVLMIEGNCDYLTEQQVIDSIYFGHEAIRKICIQLKVWREEVGKPKNREGLRLVAHELVEAVSAIAFPGFGSAMRIRDKKAREKALATIKKTVMEQLCPTEGESKYPEWDVLNAWTAASSNYLRQMILSEGIRCDGRSMTDIRPIDIEQGLLPRTHGSSLFTRGETQALAVCTLGGEGMAQRYESLDGESSHRFYLQYFFPPFSVGEVSRVGAPGRREVGHGKLAERALKAALPAKEEFPYTIRLESNITESNGSSSMATVCGGCLALMDAGVPIKRPVAGIAMGLVLEQGKYKILSDILGIEDALGDMDFKITGDREGITAFQMDIKVEGITHEIMEAALLQAREGRIHILEKMLQTCPKSKEQLSLHAPRIELIKINPSKIATIIGPGGKQIRAIIEETGVEIDINDDGVISISSPNFERIEKAKTIINGLVAEIEIGRVYTGKVSGITAFGVFVEILPGKEGLCHISEYSHERVASLNGLVKEGDILTVKVLDINERGQLKLSRKATLAKT